jgi:hypothetical protein
VKRLLSLFFPPRSGECFISSASSSGLAIDSPATAPYKPVAALQKGPRLALPAQRREPLHNPLAEEAIILNKDCWDAGRGRDRAGQPIVPVVVRVLPQAARFRHHQTPTFLVIPRACSTFTRCLAHAKQALVPHAHVCRSHDVLCWLQVDPFIARHLREHQKQGVIFLYECVMGLRNPSQNGAVSLQRQSCSSCCFAARAAVLAVLRGRSA